MVMVFIVHKGEKMGERDFAVEILGVFSNKCGGIANFMKSEDYLYLDKMEDILPSWEVAPEKIFMLIDEGEIRLPIEKEVCWAIVRSIGIRSSITCHLEQIDIDFCDKHKEDIEKIEDAIMKAWSRCCNNKDIKTSLDQFLSYSTES